jgi:hypothetical protein
LAVRGGGPYSPYGNTEGPSAAEWKRSPVGVDMTNHKVRGHGPERRRPPGGPYTRLVMLTAVVASK